MDKRILWTLFLLAIWILLGAWFHHAMMGGNATKSHSSALVASDKDGNNVVASTDDHHFNFKNSDAEYYTPLNASVLSVVDKTASYLKNNDDKALQITGWYKDNESNSSTMKNLGLARASHVKRLFSGKGVNEGQLTTDGQIENDMILLGDSLLRGPITFTIIDRPKGAVAFGDLKQKFADNPVVIQFDTANDHPSLSQEQRKDVGDLIYYIKNVPNSKLDIIGHSDSRGNRNSNIEKGKKRAEYIKDYLVENGLVAARGNVISYGPDKPIADNNTSAGRAKNRRVELVLN